MCDVFYVIIPCAATFWANNPLWKTQFKEKLTAFVFRVEFLLKIYDTELAFVCFSFRHNDFTSLFVAMPILYHTICPFVWTFACWEKVIVIYIYWHLTWNDRRLLNPKQSYPSSPSTLRAGNMTTLLFHQSILYRHKIFSFAGWTLPPCLTWIWFKNLIWINSDQYIFWVTPFSLYKFRLPNF